MSPARKTKGHNKKNVPTTKASKARPVSVSPEGDLIFLYPGFAPFVMDLRYIYIVFGQTLKLAKLGRTCEAYNGNGERLDMSIDLTECVKCVDRGGDCVLDQLKPPNDQTGLSVLYKVKMCPTHLAGEITRQGVHLPTMFTIPKDCPVTHVPKVTNTSAKRTAPLMPNKGKDLTDPSQFKPHCIPAICGLHHNLSPEKTRPVFVSSAGELMFLYPGFTPFKMNLSSVYLVMSDDAVITNEKKIVEVYDGNGYRLCSINLHMMINFTCKLMVQGCGFDILQPYDKDNKNTIYVLDICPKHVYEQVTKQGFVLPTEIKLTPRVELAEEIICPVKQRPVIMSPAGHLMFAYQGFVPFKIKLSCIYIVAPSCLARYVYDGNGRSMSVDIDLGLCKDCWSMDRGCYYEEKTHMDSKALIHVVKMCYRHLSEQITSKGAVLPTEADLEIDSIPLPFEMPADRLDEMMNVLLKDWEELTITDLKVGLGWKAPTAKESKPSPAKRSNVSAKKSKGSAKKGKGTATVAPWDDVE